jgi:hypothetical protein
MKAAPKPPHQRFPDRDSVINQHVIAGWRESGWHIRTP